MRVNAYSVFDSAVAAYMQPFFLRSDAEALRNFTDLCMDEKTNIAKHPEHYSLWSVGIFNDQSGKFTHDEPVCLGKAHEIIAQSRSVDQVKDKVGSVGVKSGGDGYLHPRPHFSGNGGS